VPGKVADPGVWTGLLFSGFTVMNLARRIGNTIKHRKGDTRRQSAIQSSMKQPTDQQERNEDKKTPEKENPSHGIDPESKEPEMEVDQDRAERQKENQNQKKNDPLAA
jgi:hypothetical protein